MDRLKEDMVFTLTLEYSTYTIYQTITCCLIVSEKFNLHGCLCIQIFKWINPWHLHHFVIETIENLYHDTYLVHTICISGFLCHWSKWDHLQGSKWSNFLKNLCKALWGMTLKKNSVVPKSYWPKR